MTTTKQTKTQPRTAANKKAMLEALAKKMGMIGQACKAVGINIKTYERWIKNDDEFRQKVEAIEYENLDLAESKLLKAVKEENLTAIMYYLNNKGKARGYNQRIEVTDAEGKAIFPFSWEKALGKNGDTDKSENKAQ